LNVMKSYASSAMLLVIKLQNAGPREYPSALSVRMWGTEKIGVLKSG
jgi:hypothetical protein